MEYLNEDNFKDLDVFIENCTDTSAAIGDLNLVTSAIAGALEIPILSKTVYVGELNNNTNGTLEYYQHCIDMGVELHEDEYAHFQELLASYEEMQNNLK